MDNFESAQMQHWAHHELDPSSSSTPIYEDEFGFDHSSEEGLLDFSMETTAEQQDTDTQNIHTQHNTSHSSLR
jgi:hypothetical protein